MDRLGQIPAPRDKGFQTCDARPDDDQIQRVGGGLLIPTKRTAREGLQQAAQLSLIDVEYLGRII